MRTQTKSTAKSVDPTPEKPMSERVKAAITQREQAQAAGTLTPSIVRYELGEKVRDVTPQGQWHDMAVDVLRKDEGLLRAVAELAFAWPDQRPA